MPVGTLAGPTLHSAAQPDFRDPLSRARSATAGPIAAPGPGVDNPEVAPAAIEGALEGDGVRLSDPVLQSLPEAEIDDIARTVRDEFLGQGTPEALNSAEQPVVTDNGDGSATSVIRNLINAVPGQSNGTLTEAGAEAKEDNSASSLIDATLNDLIVTILNPELAADGMVTFSIGGFGDFALLLLQESGGMFLIDMESGTAVKFAEAPRTVSANPQSRLPGSGNNQERGPSNALQRVVEIIERNILPVVTSPITLATITLFGMIWVIWRISARE